MAKYQTYIGIDPGVSTGLAYVDVANGQKIITIECSTVRDFESIDQFLHDHQGQTPTVITERSPIMGEQDQYARVEKVCSLVHEYDLPLIIFSPGDWKPIAQSRDWKSLYREFVHTIHENDALSLVLYYLWRFLDI